MSTIWAKKVGLVIELSFRYDEELVHLVRNMPTRSWHPTGKFWSIPESDFAMFVREAGKLGHRIAGYQIGSSETDNRAGAQSWAVDLFRAVGKERAHSVYRALSKVLHPDLADGSVELMKQLNRAYDKWR